MVDEKAATKSGLTLTVPNEAKIKEILSENRENWNKKEVEKFVENGIEYFIEKKF
jgi:hypothetical protein